MTDDRDPGWAPLDPKLDADRWEAMVRGILRRAAPVLESYARPGPADWLASWSRPALAAAALVAALALGALMAAGGAESDSAIGLGDALGYPAPVTEWMSTGVTPTIEELVVAMEERDR